MNKNRFAAVLAAALFLCGYAVMQIIQKILCSILQVVLFFAAVALGGENGRAKGKSRNRTSKSI